MRIGIDEFAPEYEGIKGDSPMTTNKLAVSLLFAATLACSPMIALAQHEEDHRAKQDMRDAGHETKEAAKDTGRGVKHGTEKAYHSTKRGTKKAWNKTKDTTNGAVRGAKEGAHQSDDYDHNRPH
jgi:Ni/Co efflux regulator RcnB